MSNHWDQYYGTGQPPEIPSQFCVFVANEFPDVQDVVEAGCGNGRDALYFAALGKRVVAFDASPAAVENCRSRHNGSAQFIVGKADESETWQGVRQALRESEGPILLYNRFFLHAIDDQAEMAFLRHASRLLKDRGGHLCLECRTVRDADHVKVTPDHYRRFIEPLHLAARLHEVGLGVDYFVEGYGMAKYRADDAHVVRLITS